MRGRYPQHGGRVMIAAALVAAIALSAPMSEASVPERTFLACVQEHESRGNPRAENPISTASGLYQFIDATWRGNAKWARWGNEYPARKYRRASQAPRWIQDLVALHSVRQGGFRHWHGTGCRYKGVVA
jgi:soluble lytic murein transglycosylase-like protein